MKKYLTNKTVLFGSLLVGALGLFTLYRFTSWWGILMKLMDLGNTRVSEYSQFAQLSSILSLPKLYNLNLIVVLLVTAGYGYIKFVAKKQDRSTTPMFIASAILLAVILLGWSKMNVFKTLNEVTIDNASSIFSDIFQDPEAISSFFGAIVHTFLLAILELMYAEMAIIHIAYAKELGLDQKFVDDSISSSFVAKPINTQNVIKVQPLETRMNEDSIQTDKARPNFPPLP